MLLLRRERPSLVVHSVDSSSFSGVAMQILGGSVDNTASRGLGVLIIVYAMFTRSFKIITRMSC